MNNLIQTGKFPETIESGNDFSVKMSEIWSRGSGVVLFLFVMIVFTASVSRDANAQTGTITGEVIESETGEALPGATVLIEGTTIGTSTDIDGRYTLRRVPEGVQTLVFQYIGFVTEVVTVTVEADERVEQNMQLTGDYIEGDEVLVVGYQRGQARALTQQRESVNIRSVMSSEQIDRMTVTTVSDALSRITGMHGGTNIRGVGSGMSNVTVDGQRMGTTGDNRSVDLSTIPTDMVRDLEVIKVITPDMDADALAGVINITTRRPVGGQRDLNIRMGGGSIPRFQTVAGPSARAAISYGDSPRNDFSYALNFSYQVAPSVSENSSNTWELGNYGQGPQDILYRLSNEIRFDPRERYSTGLQMTFQPTERTTYHVQGMFNIQQRETSRYGTQYTPRIEAFINNTETQLSGPHCISCSGSVRYYARQDPSTTYQYTMRAGARHLFDTFDMEYKLGWGHSRAFAERYDFEFATDTRYAFTMNLDDRHNPLYEIKGLNGELPAARMYRFNTFDQRWSEGYDNELSATIDFTFPYSWGSVKFGSSSRMTLKDGNSERFPMSYDVLGTLADFDVHVNQDWRVLDRDYHSTYHIPWLLDLNSARDVMLSHYPFLKNNMDEESWAFDTETSSYFAREQTSAAYGMTTLKFGRFSFLGGLRIEYSDNKYRGRQGATAIDRSFLGAEDVTSTNRYAYLFPNAQFVYSLTRMTNFRLAYSRSIGRPSFTELAPYRMEHHRHERVDRGNPELKPMISDNYDLLFEHYLMNIGEITLGLFYKQLSDFVYRQEVRIVPGQPPYEVGWDDFAEWRDRTYRNGDEATVYGFETSWQQHLDFLPGFLSNFGAFANYSYTRSFTKIARRDEYVPVRGQRPHIANVGLDYNQGGFSSTIFYSWSSPVMVAYGELRFVPEIHSRRVYFDRYEDGRNNLTLSLRYRLNSNFRIWVDVSNIFAEEVMQYSYNRDFYPESIGYHTRSISMGLRYNL